MRAAAPARRRPADDHRAACGISLRGVRRHRLRPVPPGLQLACGATARCRCSSSAKRRTTTPMSYRSLAFASARGGAAYRQRGPQVRRFLGLVTQRPAQLDPTLISQCSDRLRHAHGERGRSAHRPCRGLRSGQPPARLPRVTRHPRGAAFGAGVPVATRLRFKELPDDFIPTSEQSGRTHRRRYAVDRNLVASVVARWRGIAMSNQPIAAPPTAPAAEPAGLDLSWTAPSLK